MSYSPQSTMVGGMKGARRWKLPLTLCPGLSQSLGQVRGLPQHAWGAVLGRAPSMHLLVTSCWVFSGRLPATVDSGGTVVLVSQDGIQRPPFRFPKGGHLLQFLSCLENGLLPHGQLDPPLWSQRGKVSECGVDWGARVGVCLGARSLLPVGPRMAPGLMRACQDPQAVQAGRQVCPGAMCRMCSFRAKYFPNCASEALRVPPSPHLQTRKMTRPRITCSGSSTLACSLNSVSCPVPGPCPWQPWFPCK